MTCCTQKIQKWLGNLYTHCHSEFQKLSTEVYYRVFLLILVKVMIKITSSSMNEAAVCSPKSYD